MIAPAHSAVGRRWPRNARNPRAMQSAIGLTLTSLYTCEEASGNLVDVIGGINLTAVGTPAYRDDAGAQRKLGVAFNSTVDGFLADVHDFAANPFFYGGVIYFPTTLDTTIFGRNNASSDRAAFVGVNVPASGTIRGVLRGATGSVLLAPATDLRTKTAAIGLQVDTAGTTARLGVKVRGEPAVIVTASIATLGSVSGLNQGFGLCNMMPGLSSQPGGFTCYKLAVAGGAQCCGVDVLPRFFAGLGF